MMHWEQLDRGDAELPEMLDCGGGTKRGVGSTLRFRNFRMEGGETLYVNFIDNGVGPGGAGRPSSPQSKAESMTTLLGIKGALLRLSRRNLRGAHRPGIRTGCRPSNLSFDGLRIRIYQQFGGIEAQAV